jgi:hypothetical protein
VRRKAHPAAGQRRKEEEKILFFGFRFPSTYPSTPLRASVLG